MRPISKFHSSFYPAELMQDQFGIDADGNQFESQIQNISKIKKAQKQSMEPTNSNQKAKEIKNETVWFLMDAHNNK